MTNKTILTLKCTRCGKEYQITGKLFKARERKGTPNYCFDCIKVYSAEKAKKSKENMSPEKKAEYYNKLSEANKKCWDNMDENTKEERFDKLRKQNEELQKNMTPEKLKEHIRNIAEGKAKMTEEKRQRMLENMSKSMKKHHAGMSVEEKEIFSQQIKNGMSNMSEAEKRSMKDAWTNWWNSLPKNDKDEHLKPFQNGLQNYWDNLPKDEKAAFIRKIILNSSGKNNLHQKFEKYFDNSILSQKYRYISEYVSNNDAIHSWDYGIFDNSGNLIAVVDLDGSYFHADNCDYDGMHSKEEYDEKRSLSVPDGIKIFIIQENNFSKCFQEMIKELIMNYDEYIDYIFKICRSMPFPEPQYSARELYNSFKNLCNMNCDDKYHQDISLNTRIGDRIILHFHPSIYTAHKYNEMSPHDAWYNDDLLRKCIENRVIYQNHLNPNKILQGFNVSRIAPKVSVFSAGRAKMIINKYLKEYDEIFDPFSGFSGRMLGAMSLGKQYIGQDISEIHVRESTKMISYFSFKNADIECKDMLSSNGTYQCLFTCPPYGDKEQWVDVPVSYRSCDDWIDECISHFKCKRYVFVVDDTIKYRNYIVDVISNKSHLNNNNESIIVINE